MPDGIVAGRLSSLVAGWRVPPAGTLALLVGILALVGPTLLNLARHHWSTSDGGHGPIILVTGLWLLLRDREGLSSAPGAIHPAWLLLAVPLIALLLYGRTFRLLGVESAAVMALLILLGCATWGPAAIRARWVPILYLGLLIKPPDLLVAQLTQPLKIGISEATASLLRWFDYPIASSGVLIQVGQYELLVQQACAGLGSLFTLVAMGMLYVQLTQPRPRYQSITLLLLLVPIALLANLLRVVVLVLLTVHGGDALAQGFLHDMAGLVTFVLSMGGLLASDRIVTALGTAPR